MKLNKSIFSIRKLVMMALLIAMQIVLSRFVGLQVSESLRISVETVPILLAGFWLGPVCGMIVGVLADLLGTVISGYGVYFAPLGVTPLLVGLLSGLSGRFLIGRKMPGVREFFLVIATVIVTEVIASLFYGTLAVKWYVLFFSSKEVSYSVLFASRAVSKLPVMLVDAVLTALLYRLTYRPVAMKFLQKNH